MTSPLRDTLNDLASEFAMSVLRAIRGVSLEEILHETGGGAGGGRTRGGRGAAPARATGGRAKGGRLARRSTEDIAGVVDKIVSLLEKHQTGLRAEEIRGKLKLQAKELPRPIAEALSKKRIVKEGQKRATTYFARDAKRAKAG